MRTADTDESANANRGVDALLEPAVPGGLTAEQVAKHAAATSYSAAEQAHALAAAETRVNQALVAYFPKLELTASYTRKSPITPPAQALWFPMLLDYYLLEASLVIPLTDYVLRLSQSYAAASHSAKACELNEKAARLNASLAGRVAYYTWARATAQVRVAERNLQVTRAHLVDAQDAFEVGTASKADVMSAEAQVASAELLLVQEQDAVTAAEDQIRIAMHDRSGRAFTMGEDLRESSIGAWNEDLSSLREEALERRLEIRALDETSWSLRQQASATRAGLYPKIEGVGDLTHAQPNPRVFPQIPEFRTTWELGVRLTWTPNDTLTARETISEMEARASQTLMQKGALMDSVKAEVLQAYQALSQARVAIETTSRSLAAVEESYRVRRELFRGGRAKSLELQDAEIALLRAGFESINARANLKIAHARLRHAVGRDVADMGTR